MERFADAAHLRARLRAQEAQIEGLKAKARSDGPDTARKSVGGSKSYSDLTFEERMALTDDERDAMT
ncbi:hypothetical protein LCGC14_2873560 [marine sediment metagenome]|uniref:Uncharacterized protein n=1 Tax=marine sediment metagenome TaxID=412755 RepID=A0A0F8Y253_9ZZZZ